MTDEPSAPPPANTALEVLAAIANLGEATPAAIAVKVGIAYSTVNPKLRAWENAGLAERVHADGQTRWRLTAAGRESTATLPRDTVPGPATDAVKTGGMAAAGSTAEPATLPSSAEPQTRAKESRQLAASGADGISQDSGPPTGSAAHRVEPDVTPVDPLPAPQNAQRGGTAAEPAAVVTAEPAIDQGIEPGAPPTPVAPAKRPKGALEASLLDILRANAGTEYKVIQLCRLVDQADSGTGYPKASGGAVANALTKLTVKGHVIDVPAKHYTVRAAPAAD